MQLQKFFITLIAIMMMSAPAFAWDNETTHPNLTNRAVQLLIKTDAGYGYLSDYANFNIKTDRELTFLDEGAVKEDYGISSGWNESVWGRQQDANVPKLSWKSHGYNPHTGKAWYGMPNFENALNYSHSVWNDINTTSNPYFQTGRFCHLIEDMASPAHAHADAHVSGDDLEAYSKHNYNRITYNPVIVRSPANDGLISQSGLPHPTLTGDSYDNYLQNVAWRTYYMTSYYGGYLVTKEGNRQPDSELKRMFPYYDGGLRYDDGGWFTNDSYVIDDVGNNWIGFGIGMNPDWWECPEDPRYFYLENIDGDDNSTNPSMNGYGVAPAVFKKNKFKRVRPYDNLNQVLAPNTKILAKIYSENLYVLSTEWVAGFIKHAAQ